MKLKVNTVYIAHINLIKKNQISSFDKQKHRFLTSNEYRYLKNNDKKLHFLSRYFIYSYLKTNHLKLNDLTKSVNDKLIIKKNNYYFSLSHSKNYCVFVCSNKPIGIDIQYVQKINYRLIADKIFNKKIFNNLNDFYIDWTNRESLIKCFDKKMKINDKPNDFNFLSKKILNRYVLSICHYKKNVKFEFNKVLNIG